MGFKSIRVFFMLQFAKMFHITFSFLYLLPNILPL